MNNIYNTIKEVRESKGLKKSEVADRLGIHRSAYGRMEKTGKPQLTIERLGKLAEILEVEVVELITRNKMSDFEKFETIKEAEKALFHHGTIAEEGEMNLLFIEAYHPCYDREKELEYQDREEIEGLTAIHKKAYVKDKLFSFWGVYEAC